MSGAVLVLRCSRDKAPLVCLWRSQAGRTGCSRSKGRSQEAVGAQRGHRSQPGGLGRLSEAGDSYPGLTVEGAVSQAQGVTEKEVLQVEGITPADLLQDSA